jgi:2-polyprenyl-3-methyl-5-hydroxy-6-metoxy-1,4-benzoquinol methylase
MEKKTLKIYDENPERFAQGWLSQEGPGEIYEVVRKYFKPGALTADIGSGSGRDVEWLNQNGYPCTGFDASRGLLKVAQEKFPNREFRFAQLPLLEEIPDESYQQILCETVLMHLDEHEHVPAIKNLFRILRCPGVLTLSWRMAEENPEKRDAQGRLYEFVDGDLLIKTALSLGARLVHRNLVTSASTGKQIEQMVFVRES